MSKKYLKRNAHSLFCGETFLKAIQRVYFLLAIFLLVSPLVLAELPTSSDLDATVGLDIGVHFIRPESKYLTPNSGKPHFLSVDSINFIACIEAESTPRAFVICSDNNNFNEVDLYPWPNQERCYVGGMSLSDFSCTDATVQVEYAQDNENLKITGDFIISTFSTVVEKLLNSQYNDGGWRSALDTAFGVRALSHFSEIFDFEINQGLKWLKLNRNNENKCWPKSPCNLEETTKILSLLANTNLNDSYRIVNDGKNFLEQRQNYYEQGDNWTVEVSDISTGTTVSLVAINTTILYENFTLPANGTQSYTFEAYRGDVLSVITDDDVIMEVYNQDGLLRYEFQGDNLSYTLPGACWSLNLPGEPCDTGTTAYAASTNLTAFRIDQAKEYMKTEIDDGVIKHHYGDANEPVESALYVKRFYDEDLLADEDEIESFQEGTYVYDVLQWVLFKQNNEGYWGDEFTGDTEDDNYDYLLSLALEDQLKTSAFVIMALLDSGFNRSSESVVDAHDWVSNIEEDLNESSGGSLGAALFIVQNNAYPLVYTNPSTIILDAQVKEVSFINPTPFEYRDLSFTLSDSLKDFISVEEKDFLSAFNYRTIKFRKLKSSQSALAGFVSIGNADQEIGRIPVVVFDSPTLDISSATSASVFGTVGSIKLTATKSAHAFDCSVIWSDSSLSSKPFKLTKSSHNVDISFDSAKTTENLYDGTLTCKSLSHSFEFPLSVQITRYIDTPLTIFPSSILVNDSSAENEILVKNNLDIDLSITLNTNQFNEELLFPQELFLLAGTSQNITVLGSFDPSLNYTGTTRLSFSTLDTSNTVSVIVDVQSSPRSSANLIRLVIMLTFFLIVLGVAGYFGYKYRDDILKAINEIPLFQSKVTIKQKQSSLDNLRVEERHQAIMNMYSIMRFQQATDVEIKKRLTGIFSKAELLAVFEKEGIILEGMEETEPEKV